MLKKVLLAGSLVLASVFAKAQAINNTSFTPSLPLESSFTTAINGEEMLNVFAYDFNKDGILDLAMDGGMKYPQSFEFNPSSNIIIMLGNGDGTFTQSDTYIPLNTLFCFSHLML